MSKRLVAYFSASGVTAKLAKTLAAAIGADLFEILPEKPYSAADLDWTNKESRSTIEMKDKQARPAIGSAPVDTAAYDVIFVGFPIWWYEAPRIVQAFLEQCELTGKTVVPFATSGGSAMGKTAEILQKSCPGATVLPGKRLRASSSAAALHEWVQSLGL